MIALPTSYCSIAQQVIALFDQGKVPPLSSLIDSGTRENFNLFSLQNGSQYLLLHVKDMGWVCGLKPSCVLKNLL